MRRVGIAAGSKLAAESAAHVADMGGNAVDSAIAATITAMCTDPGVMALGGGAFVAIDVPEADPIVIDGYMEMPGRGLDPSWPGEAQKIYTEWAGGLETIVGPGSVATPGAMKALGLASDQYGLLPWQQLMEPVIDSVAGGFEISTLSGDYLAYTHDVIFGWNPDSHKALHHADGSPLSAGDLLVVPGLDETLRQVAEEGAVSMYTGDLGHRIADVVEEAGGLLNRADLASYRAQVRPAIQLGLDDWRLASNPPPAVGGASVLAILGLAINDHLTSWDEAGARRFAEVQAAVLGYRETVLEMAGGDRVDEVAKLMEMVDGLDLEAINRSSSTSHTSVVDSKGVACSITASAGYGSGMLIPGTGMWMNNSLGEIELNPLGYHSASPGTRLLSNMAPTVGRSRSGAVLAAGSPGASRITSALASVLINLIHLGMSVHKAVESPRLHVGLLDGVESVVLEPGMPDVDLPGLPMYRYPDISSYFGGVQMAMWDPISGLFEAADPRRSGEVREGGISRAGGESV